MNKPLLMRVAAMGYSLIEHDIFPLEPFRKAWDQYFYAITVFEAYVCWPTCLNDEILAGVE